jgi:hypothetical protein
MKTGCSRCTKICTRIAIATSFLGQCTAAQRHSIQQQLETEPITTDQSQSVAEYKVTRESFLIRSSNNAQIELRVMVMTSEVDGGRAEEERDP